MESNPKLIGIEFVQQVIVLVKDKKLTYMEAVIHWCETNQLEMDVGAELVKKSSLLQSKIEEEAEQLHFIRKSNRLPV
jgi:hypothetical protein